MKNRYLLAVGAVLVPTLVSTAYAQDADGSKAAEARADEWAARTESRMTDDERFGMLHGFMPLPVGVYAKPEDREKWPADTVLGAGYVAGVPRLGVPSLRETDASLGVTNPFSIRPRDTSTALPSTLALGASFNLGLARDAGRAIALEAKARNFNVLLAPGINLARDPRNGRNFEYVSEDPLLSGLVGGEAIRGIQSTGIAASLKHFSLNSNETNRRQWDAVIDRAAHRESDLLAFQIAIEKGRPASVMCAYNLVNGAESCGSDYLLNQVLKRDWGYRGWVMSDWGSTYSADFALKGLDQQQGQQLDKQVWFDGPLRAKLADGSLSRERLSDMVRRILRSIKLVGIVDGAETPAPAIDTKAHDAIALEIARQGIVLLKNDGALPLLATAKSLAVIGRNAHVGVLSGGGSSQGLPAKGWAASVPVGGAGNMGQWRIERWFGGAPVDAIKAAMPNANIMFDPGMYPQDAAAVAARAEVAIVFVNKYDLEGFDSPDMSLPYGQDAIVEAAARANPNTIVVLQTGNPVKMPWRDSVKAIVAAWYPGQEGATAIADILTGKANPSGRLPVTFPASEDQLPRPNVPGYGQPTDKPMPVTINEGADVGYRWFAARNAAPAYPFGHGLSYTRFAYSNVAITGGKSVTARVTISNTGERDGADVPQLYLLSRDGQAMQRLLAFERVELKRGESRTVTLRADPRLLANYDEDARTWRIAGGQYALAVSHSAAEPAAMRTITLKSSSFGK